MSVKNAFLTAVLTTAVVVTAGTAAAQYPEKDVNYIIPFNPGGESDIAARFQQPYFRDITGQQLIVKYQSGAGGAQAWSQLNNMPADGYTIMGTNLPHIILQPMQQDVGYETEDITNVYFFHYTPDAILVPADSQFQTAEELIQYAKDNPGLLTFSGSGSNSANHLAQQRFDELAGVQTTYIPFAGTGPALTAMLGNQVMAEMGYSTVAVQQGDQVRMLAVATEERLPRFPDVPTFKELGIDMVGGAYRGIAVPQETPEEIRQQLSDIIGQINNNPEFVQKMEEAGFVVTDIPYEDVDEFMAEQTEEIREIAQDMGIAAR